MQLGGDLLIGWQASPAVKPGALLWPILGKSVSDENEYAIGTEGIFVQLAALRSVWLKYSTTWKYGNI
jgi:hypothetical protein